MPNFVDSQFRTMEVGIWELGVDYDALEIGSGAGAPKRTGASV